MNSPDLVRRLRVADAVCEALADSEHELRLRLRIERGMLLDVVDSQRGEIAVLRQQLAAARSDLRRYTATAVSSRRAA